jgi:uncharacterized membrane protein YfcA
VNWRGALLVLGVGLVCAAVGYALGAAAIQRGPAVAAVTGAIGLLTGWALWTTRPAARAPASVTRQRPHGGPDRKSRRRKR